MEQKYLRKLGTSRVFIFSDRLAKRKDMVLHDPELTKQQIEAKKTRLAEIKALQENPEALKIAPTVLSDAEELNRLDSEIAKEEAKLEEMTTGIPTQEPDKAKSEADLEAERRQEIIEKDPDISKIEAMKEKKDVDDYVKEEFGESLDLRKGLKELKKIAIQKRIDRLFET